MAEYDQMRAVARRRHTTEDPARRERHAAKSKEELVKNLTKKFQTAFVGPLATFEKYFGDVWGLGLPAAECSESQLRSREDWEACRNEILTNGNNQARAARAELDLYTVNYERYQTKLNTKEDAE